MALFRFSISKQRVFASKVCSLAVNDVHSQPRYTSACSDQKQQLKVQTSYQSKNNTVSLLNTKDNKYWLPEQPYIKLYGNGKDYRTDNTLQQQSLLANIALPVDSLTTATHLALISLSYDEKWRKQCSTICNNAMKSRELLGYNDARTIKDITFPLDKFQDQQGKAQRVKRGNLHSPSNVAMFIEHCKDVTTQKEKKNLDDKCDPLLLATVYQALRNELPAYFQKGHSFELYHKNVKFVNGLTNSTISGLRKYKCVMTSMRLAAQICLSDIRMDILKITKESTDCNIKVRWRVSGIPRYMTLTGYPKDGDCCRYIDGFSIFDVDVNGRIYCHRLLKLMPSQSPGNSKNPLLVLKAATMTALLRQQKSFEMFTRHRVEDIEEACLPV